MSNWLARDRTPLKMSLRSVFFVVVLLSFSTTACQADSDDRDDVDTLANNATSSLSAGIATSTNTSTIILTETELYDGKAWQAVSWNEASTGDASPSPSEYPDPSDGNWISEWKIVTGTTRDEFGWDYKTNRKRRRTWIRTFETYNDKHASNRFKTWRASSGTPSTSVTASVAPRTRVVPITRLARAIRESYNFKGFGLTVYKSLVFRHSFGVALRVPVTFNFNLWEEHPSLPSVGASVAIYHPWVVCLFVSTSLRMEVLQWAITTSVATVIYAVCWLLWTVLLRGLIVAGAAILFPVTRRLYQPTFPLAKPNWLGPEYSRSAEERLGISWSWRYSQARGYEFRTGYWHYFAHSMVALLKAWNVQRIPNWVVRRVAAVGTSISTPIPDQPFITANTLLSLSGIYFTGRSTEHKRRFKRDGDLATALKPIGSVMQIEEDTTAAADDDGTMDLSSKSLPTAKLLSKTRSKIPL